MPISHLPKTNLEVLVALFVKINLHSSILFAICIKLDLVSNCKMIFFLIWASSEDEKKAHFRRFEPL